MRNAFALALATAALTVGTIGCNRPNTSPQQVTPGGPEAKKTAALETSASLLQRTTPLNQFGIYLVGFHPMKDDPAVQMEAHHYCNQVNEDFAQCVLFDGNTKNAQLNGIEYIVSEKLFRTFPPEERQYWHPHNYEILSGELIAPGVPEPAEHSFMAQKMNSYGKTWHVWETDNRGKPNLPLPFGPPHLAWSFNHDGEIASGMIERRDDRMHSDTERARRNRSGLSDYAHPQFGVDDLRSQFPDGDGAPKGVSAVNAPAVSH